MGPKGNDKQKGLIKLGDGSWLDLGLLPSLAAEFIPGSCGLCHEQHEPDFSNGFYFGDFGEYYVAPGFYLPKPECVIFNDKTTVVFWSDNTKTIVSCDKDDVFQEEFGFAMACMKKLFGSRANFKAQFENAVRQKPKAQIQLKKKKARDKQLRDDRNNVRAAFDTIKRRLETFDSEQDI